MQQLSRRAGALFLVAIVVHHKDYLPLQRPVGMWQPIFEHEAFPKRFDLTLRPDQRRSDSTTLLVFLQRQTTLNKNIFQGHTSSFIAGKNPLTITFTLL